MQRVQHSLSSVFGQADQDPSRLTPRSIDGVLLRSNTALPGAREALQLLHQHGCEYAFLTNGGGGHEADKAATLTEKLNIEIGEHQVVQSHSPFAELRHLHDKTVLVLGGEHNNCRDVAHR